jgi:hypothetical protein
MMNLNHVEVNKQKKLPHMMNLNHVEVTGETTTYDEPELLFINLYTVQVHHMW